MNYEVGKWYWSDRYNITSIFKFSEIDGERFMYSEGYDEYGIKNICFGGLLSEQIKGLATPAQIERCLKSYAEKKGYVGAKVVIDMGILGGIHYLVDGPFRYIQYPKEEYLVFGENEISLYQNGKWAEIVKENTTITIGFDENLIDVDGNNVPISELIDVYRKYKQIKDICK